MLECGSMEVKKEKQVDLTVGDFASALQFAAEKHKNQKRKGEYPPPYINHPIDLVEVLTNTGKVKDWAPLIVAILHDTIEDTETSKEEIKLKFGEQILANVLEVSDDKLLCKADRKQAQIDHAPHLTTTAKLVKLADKICNIIDVRHSPPSHWTTARRIRYFEWSKCVVDGMRGTNDLLESSFDEYYTSGLEYLEKKLEKEG